MWTNVSPFPEFLEESSQSEGYRIQPGLNVIRLAILSQLLKRRPVI